MVSGCIIRRSTTKSFILVVVSAWAAGASTAGSLTVEESIALVLRNHPGAQAGTALEEAGRAEVRAARRLPDPLLGLSWSRARALEGPRGDERGLQISQVLPWPGSYTAGVQAAQGRAAAWTAAAEEVRWQVAAEAREAFYRLLAAQQAVEIAAGAEDDARRLFDLMNRRAKVGEARESDRIKARVEWLRQVQAVEAARREAEAAEVRMRLLAGEPLPETLVLVGDLPVTAPPVAGERLLPRLRNRNPLLQQAAAAAMAEEAALVAVRRGRLPDVELTLFREEELDKEAEGAALGLRLPLWNARRGEIARATASRDLAAAERRQQLLALEVELEERVQEFEVAARQAAAFSEELLPAAARTLDLVRLSFEAGETSLLDLLDAQRTYRGLEQEALESRLALALAGVGLQRLLGPDFDPWR